MKKLIVLIALLIGAAPLCRAGREIEKPLPQYSDDIANILQSIPSPLEICFLIKEISKDYNKSNLNNPSFVGNYTMSHKMALNLGVYSTDLGYVNLYGQTQDVNAYLDAVRKLAQGLDIERFFDYNHIKELANSKSNLKELLAVTQRNFEQITVHLGDQKRESISILMLTGGWIEALYLTTLVYEKTKDAKLKEKIGEQKVTLEQIRRVLNIYEDKPNYRTLVLELEQLSKIYEGVEITTGGGPAKVKEVNKELVISEGNVSEVKISERQLANITSLLRGIRDKMVR